MVLNFRYAGRDSERQATTGLLAYRRLPAVMLAPIAEIASFVHLALAMFGALLAHTQLQGTQNAMQCSRNYSTSIGCRTPGMSQATFLRGCGTTCSTTAPCMLAALAVT